MKEGLYTGGREDSFRTLGQLRRSTNPSQPVYEQPTLSQLTSLYKNRQKEREALLPIPDRIRVDFRTQDPVYIALIGDTHAGAAHVDYDRIQREVDYIKQTTSAHVMLLGDLVDGFFFMPAQQDTLGNLSEEALYAYAMFQELHGKIVAAWGGDHDLWSSKTGPSMYHRFISETGAQYLHGLSHVEMQIGSQTYLLSGAHRLPGFSMYNNTHGQMRARNFDSAHGADIVVSGHTHRKGHARQPAKDVNGSKMVDYISIGAYKSDDEYSRKLGFGRQSYDDMGGFGIVLFPDEKRISVYDDICQGLDDFKRL